MRWVIRRFDSSQNPTPVTHYDKTLHNWLRPRGEHVNQILCQSAVRERLAKYVKYKASSFLFWFFPGLAYWSDAWMDFDAKWLITRVVTQACVFWGPHDGRQQWVQIFAKLSKMAFYRHVLAATNGFKRNDAIEDWHHWRRSVPRILGITAAL